MVGSNLIEHPDSQLYKIFKPNSDELNLLDKDSIIKFLEKNNIEFIIHCAGLVAGIQFNIKYPYSSTTTNSYIGLNIIDAARIVSVPKLLNLASSCMYPKNRDEHLKETDILSGPLEPTNEGYAIAKILSTKLCEYISHENPNLLYKTLIPCNLYGRYDTYNEKFSHMIPAAISKIYNAKIMNHDHVEIWGDGKTKREFMPASELADLIWYSLKNFTFMPNILNAGLGVDYSIDEYYFAIAKILNYSGRFIHNLNAPDGMKRKVVSTKQLKSFGWKCKKNLNQGLEEAIEFYKDHILLRNQRKMKKDSYIS